MSERVSYQIPVAINNVDCYCGYDTLDILIFSLLPIKTFLWTRIAIRITFKMLPRTLLRCVPVFLLFSISCALGLRLLKDQNHSSAQLLLRVSNSDDEQADNKQFKDYHVEEFIDRSRNRSSIVLSSDGQSAIYFNEYLYTGNTQGVMQIAERRLMVYEMGLAKCKSSTLGGWPLYPLRRLLVHMLPDILNVPPMIDLALGPSSLLIAVEENLESFQFKARQYSPTSLNYLDMFVRTVDENPSFPSDEFGDFYVKIMIHRVDRRPPAKDAPLSQILSSDPTSTKSIEIASITVCKLDSRNWANLDETQQPDETYDCDAKETLVHIDFIFNSQLEARSLIGSSLDSPRGPFYKDPFLPPVGIGCFDNDLRFSSLKQFSAPSQQLSAEYFITNGTRGSGYVAYDGHNALVRLDRFGRKNIFDLNQELTYHVSEFYPSSNVSELISDRSRNCIALASSYETFVSDETAMQRLIGIGVNGESPAHYLGSKMVDHTSYDVYELELKFNQPTPGQYNLPVLLEPIGYALPTKDLGTSIRFFVTYYVRDMKHKLFDDEKENQENTIKEPKFIELWRFEVAPKRRFLINRLTFTQFSWELDVIPYENPNEDLSQLFHLDKCVQERSQQMQLRFKIVPNSDTRGKTPLTALAANSNAIKAKVGQELSELLEIPRLSISHLELEPRKSGDLLVQARISDLIEGVEDTNLLGSMNLWDVFKVNKRILKMLGNRHTFLECQLDSLQYSKTNWMLHCRSVAACLLLERDGEVKKLFTDGNNGDGGGSDPSDSDSDSDSDSNSNSGKDSTKKQVVECLAYEINWASKPEGKHEASSEFEAKESAVSRLTENLYKMMFFKMDFHYQYFDESTGGWSDFHFDGFGRSAEVKPLNSDGILGSLDSKSALIGLRYMTNSEAPDTHNMNERIQLTKTIDPFRHCQLACQMDDYCASFSYCKKLNNEQEENDCVLSTVRLSGKRMQRLATKINKSPKDKEFEFKITSMLMSQVIRFKRNDRCSLHRKDMVASFKATPMIKSMIDNGIDPFEPSNKQSDIIPKQKFERRTLEDCAEECHENALAKFMNPFDSKFTFCALDSMCLPNSGSFENLDEDHELTHQSLDHCYVYQKHHTQYYSSFPFARMMVKNPNTNSETSQKTKASPSSSSMVNPFNTEHTNNSISRVFKGLNAEECARDCSLSGSKCLAFDSCSYSAKLTLCILFSIRSPSAKINPKFPLLTVEKDYYSESENTSNGENSRVTLVSKPVCQHYALKEEYFEIRLQQMLDASAKPNRDPKMDEMEDQILNEDSKKSDATQVVDDDSGPSYNRGSSSSLTNLILFLTGIVFGVFCVQYGRQTSIYLLELIREKRSQYHANQSLGRLTLTNNMEL